MRRVILKSTKRAQSFSSSRGAKSDMRRRLISQLGADRPRILDLFCGPGGMWKHAYGSTRDYLGLDMTQYDDSRPTIVCDNSRFLRLAGLDLDQFDIFDLDAYGSPSYQLAIICSRLRWTRTNRVGIVLTDGSGFNAAMNSTNSGLLEYLGMSRHKGSRVSYDNRESVLAATIQKAAAHAGAVVEHLRKMQKRGGFEMIYVSYIMSRAA